MFSTFFYELKIAGLPVSLREYLTLLEALAKGLAAYDVESFYHLARATLVKDESNLDRFDQVFGHVFKGLDAPLADLKAAIPEDWLRKLAEKFLTEEEREKIAALGGLDKILDELAKRLAEQRGRHQGGSKWIGTAGTSPFGAYGYNPAGVRIGQDGNRNNRAVKVWDRREFKDLDGTAELGTRNIKLALRRLRRFARDGAADILDLPGTIKSTANRGWLDVQLVPERRNAVKVLLLLDIGGSMDPHIRLCEELFSAAKAEFKHLAQFYFHNCVYESVWKENRRRGDTRLSTTDMINTFGPDYKLIIVGDASMSPFELTHAGGSVEHYNEEPGATWLNRLVHHYHKAAWLNPMPERNWRFTPSLDHIQRLFTGRMYPLSLPGLEDAMKNLSR